MDLNDSSPPDSSPDPYATSSEINYPIDFAHLPLTSLGRILLLSNYESRVDRVIQKRLRLVSNTIQRRLTPDEATALAFHTHKGFITTKSAKPLGIFFGSYNAYTTRKDFRFPLLGPLKRENGWFDGERIRIWGVELGEGFYAKALIHGIRTAGYIAVGLGVATLLTSSYAGTVMAVREAKEPRLVNVTQELRRAHMIEVKEKQTELKERLNELKGKRESTSQRSPTGGNTWKEQAKAVRQETSTAREEFRDDDGSPTTEGFANDQFESLTPPINTHPSTHPSTQPPPNRPTTKPPPPPPRSTPTSTNPIPIPIPTPHPSPSAWERIRRDASPSSSRTGIAREERPVDVDEDFTFSREEEERDEAQRGFDERVERERRGGEFGYGDGGMEGGEDGDVGAGWKRERKRRAL